jgi:hypothetical protein
VKKIAGDGISFESGGQQDTAGSIFSDLVCLIQRVQEFIKVNELTITVDYTGETATDIVVLDNVMPRYLMANATRHACRAQLLLQARTAYARGRHLPISLFARRTA